MQAFNDNTVAGGLDVITKLISNQAKSDNYSRLYFHAGRDPTLKNIIPPRELIKQGIFPLGESVGSFLIDEDIAELPQNMLKRIMCNELIQNKMWASFDVIHTIQILESTPKSQIISIFDRYAKAAWHNVDNRATHKALERSIAAWKKIDYCNNNRLMSTLEALRTCIVQQQTQPAGGFLKPRQLQSAQEAKSLKIRADLQNLYRHLTQNYPSMPYQLFYDGNIQSDITNERLLSAGIVLNTATNSYTLETAMATAIHNLTPKTKSSYPLNYTNIEICKDGVIRVYLH